MNFLYPAFLFALLTVAIPILIHLFSFRRYKTVWFSNVNYLKNIRKESQKKSQLRQLLMLLARVLAIVSLVFVFSQPYLPSDNQQSRQPEQVVAVYIDNSFSMNALSSQGQLLEVARNKAVEIAGVYPSTTRFQLITNDLDPRHRHLFNKDQFIRQVSEVKGSARSIPLSQIYNRTAGNLSEQGERIGKTLYLLSDFQQQTVDLGEFRADSSLFTYLLPLRPEKVSNLYIDSCWMETPAHKLGQEEVLNVRIVNRSDEGYQKLPLKFFLNDSLKALANFDIGPQKEEVVQLKYLNFSAGNQSGYAEISDYPFTHDNTWFLSYTVQPFLKALALYSGTAPRENQGLPYLRALFAGDDYVQFDEMALENLPVSKLAAYHAIFLLNSNSFSTGLINELVKTAQNGSSVIFFPEFDGDPENYNQLLSRMGANPVSGIDPAKLPISGIEWKHPVFAEAFSSRDDDISLPEVDGHFTFARHIEVTETPLLWFRSGHKALSTQPVGDGNFVVFSFPLSAKTESFARNVLFVPTIYSLVLNSLPQQKSSWMIGRESWATLPKSPEISSTDPLTVTHAETGRQFMPEVLFSEGNMLRVNLSEYFDQAGHYRVEAGEKVLPPISMNYDRAESDLRYWDTNALQTEIEKHNLKKVSLISAGDRSFSALFDEIRNGKKLWKWFLVSALLFLLAEVLIARLLK